MPGKTWAELERERAERQRAILADQSAARIKQNQVIETARQQIEANQNAERERVLRERLRLRESDPAQWYALSDGARLEALRFESERRGFGGRDNRDAGRSYAGHVDPRFVRILELSKSDAGRYEVEFARLSSVDKMNYARWAALQAK